MHKHNCLWAITTVAFLALAGCGVQEPNDGGHGGADDPNASGQADVPGADGGNDTVGQDAGAGGNDAGSADTPSTDAGATPPAADGGAPADTAPDAGSPPADAGSPASDGGSADAGTPAPTSPAPVRSISPRAFLFADAYIGGTTCGQVRGNLPGTTWSAGPTMQDTNADHELEVSYATLPAGTYELSYVSATCPGGAAVGETWASYGSRPQLLGMTEDARSFVNCNWWDAATGMAVDVMNPGCDLRIAVDGAGVITGAGNMRNYH